MMIALPRKYRQFARTYPYFALPVLTGFLPSATGPQPKDGSGFGVQDIGEWRKRVYP